VRQVAFELLEEGELPTNAQSNFPNSIKKGQAKNGEINYLIIGKSKAGKSIEIWIDVVNKIIKTAYPSWR